MKFAALLLTLLVCWKPHLPAQELEQAFEHSKLSELDAAISSAIAKGSCPGGVLWLEHNRCAYHQAYGRRSITPVEILMDEETIFDIASLTKVIATTPAVLKLVEAKTIDLNAPASRYFPDFRGEGREVITIQQLLTHTSGLRAAFPKEAIWEGKAEALKKLCAERLVNTPGTTFLYSDLNFILLGVIIEKQSGQSLEVFCREAIFAPLGMRHTEFLPAPNSRIAPTSGADSGVVVGIVHDPTARRMGGVAGHAGVFSTIEDLARFSRMLLNGGELDGVRILEKETVALMTSPQTSASVGAIRGLGWDIQSPFSSPKGAKFSAESFGHTGWTGCSIWLDPASHTFVLFFSNRTYPNDTGNVVELRSMIGTLAAEAVK